MVGAATAVLSRRRAAGLAAVLAALIVWDAWAGVLPNVGLWPDVLIAAFIVLPVTFAVPWLVLPVAPSRAVAVLAVILVALAALFYLVGFGSLFNVTKLLALTAIGFLFVQAFEALSWVVLIAVIIPWVDALSVWRGPTNYVVSEKPSLFERISIEFRLPGETGSANIGPPDILFFALFLGGRVPLRPESDLDLAVDGRAARADADHDDRVRLRRPPGSAGDRARIPAAERRPALAALAGARSRGARARGEAYASRRRRGSRSTSSSRLTLSMCGVCGNMSTGTHRRSS